MGSFTFPFSLLHKYTNTQIQIQIQMHKYTVRHLRASMIVTTALRHLNVSEDALCAGAMNSLKLCWCNFVKHKTQTELQKRNYTNTITNTITLTLYTQKCTHIGLRKEKHGNVWHTGSGARLWWSDQITFTLVIVIHQISKLSIESDHQYRTGLHSDKIVHRIEIYYHIEDCMFKDNILSYRGL